MSEHVGVSILPDSSAMNLEYMGKKKTQEIYQWAILWCLRHQRSPHYHLASSFVYWVPYVQAAKFSCISWEEWGTVLHSVFPEAYSMLHFNLICIHI